MSTVCPACGRQRLRRIDGTATLTTAQISVLRMVDAGLTTREVASEMWLSVETIRWHLKSIHRRLEVHERADALIRARELGLLGDAAAPEEDS